MLWDQHRDRWTVGELKVRRVTYTKFRELTRNFPQEDLARIGRLNAKRDSGAELTAEEQASLAEIASRWPVDALRGACMIPPTDAEGIRKIIADMPRRTSEALEKILDKCIVPEIPAEDVADPLAILLASRGALGIDVADLTAGQGLALIAMLTPREG